MTTIRPIGGVAAAGKLRRRWTASAAALVAVLGLLIAAAPAAEAIVITGGPSYSPGGGWSCTTPTAGTEKNAGGATMTCTGTAGAFSNLYIGIKNNNVPAGTVPIGEKMNSNGTTEPTGAEIFAWSTETANTIVYTGTTTHAGIVGTVFTRMTLTFTNTGSVVDDATTQALSNGNGAVHSLWRIGPAVSSMTVNAKIEASTSSGGPWTAARDFFGTTAIHRPGTGSTDDDKSHVDIGFYTSTCGDSTTDTNFGREQCDLGGSNGASTSCCTSACQFRSAGQTCRTAAGTCDLADTCTGSSATCPADAKSTAQCRAAVSVCDLAENCNGVSNNCPADAFASSSTLCRGVGGVCDIAENCTGTSNTCPTDIKSTALCRGAAGVCDTAESCDGVNDDCPANAFEPPTTACGDPTDTECSNPDSCDGAGACSPNDETSGTSCGDDGEICTVDECNGSGTCAHPAGNAGTECRAASAGQLCDEAEECDGVSGTCPADAPKNAGVVCRPTAGECDADDECDGVNFQCPPDGFAPSGTACTADSEICTLDICDGNNNCTHPAGNAGTECRAVAGVCDAAEQCNGTSTTCPADASQPDGTACTDDGLFCDGAESCQAGTCTSAGDPCNVGVCDEGGDQCLAGCTAAPLSGCRTAAKSILSVKDDVANSKDKLIFKWIKGASTDKTEFADPTASTDYALCIYSGSPETLVMEANVPPSSTKWDEKTKGYKYKDPSRLEDGISKIILKGSNDNNSKALVKGQGANLPDDPAASNPALELDLPVKAQLVNLDTEVCFEGNYDTSDIKKNESGKFKAKEQ